MTEESIKLFDVTHKCKADMAVNDGFVTVVCFLFARTTDFGNWPSTCKDQAKTLNQQHVGASENRHRLRMAISLPESTHVPAQAMKCDLLYKRCTCGFALAQRIS